MRKTQTHSCHNETFHRMIYHVSGNEFLAAETLRLSDRLSPCRPVQFQMRGRMTQSMAEYHALMATLTDGRATEAADILRNHVGTQGKRLYQEMATLRQSAANRNVD